ncbi:MAG: prenyltransferase [Candidatus Bathyarchaeota archaeon]|nr:prenyltransferase [Candidatus Bathyarchaeota archaeon]
MLKLLQVVRPHIVVGGFLGYVAGVLFGLNNGGAISWTGFIVDYLIVLFMDLSTHFNNDYFDVEADKHQPFKPFGNKNIFLEHPELLKTSLYASIASTIISLTLATTMIRETSWHLLATVALFNILGWLYSTPPVKLSSRRLGEATIAIGTGFCVPAVGYIVATGRLTDVFTPFMVQLVLYGYVLSLCLQIPDYEVDQKMGKNTIVGLIGRKKTYVLILLIAVIASLNGFMFLSVSGILVWLRWATLVPLVVSLSGLLVSGSHEDAKRYTLLNVSGLFIYLIIVDIVLLLGSGLF